MIINFNQLAMNTRFATPYCVVIQRIDRAEFDLNGTLISMKPMVYLTYIPECLANVPQELQHT